MSQVKIQGNASGTGIFTIAAPNSNSNYTFTLPTETGTVLTNTGPYTASSSATAGAVTIDASNNVGIGTGSPDDITSGYTTVDVRGSTGGGLRLGVAGGNNMAIYASATTSVIDAAGTAALQFSTSGSERARIDSSGNLLVGQTAADAKFVVTGSATSGWGARVLQSSGSGTPQGLQVVVGQNSTNEVFQCAQGTSFASITNLFRVSGNGTINTGTATGSPYNLTTGSGANAFLNSNGDLQRSTSSLKYKRDVQDAAHGLADVMALRAVTYKGKSEADGETVFGGLIAEEVHAAGLTEFVQYAADGTPDALAYGNMVSLAFKAIQEQQALIESLTARMDAQAAEIAALKGAQA